MNMQAKLGLVALSTPLYFSRSLLTARMLKRNTSIKRQASGAIARLQTQSPQRPVMHLLSGALG
jgi:hypothetical protein